MAQTDEDDFFDVDPGRVYFRVIGVCPAYKVKIPATTPLKHMFAKIMENVCPPEGALGVFLWGTHRLDPSLSASDYGMLSGKEKYQVIELVFSFSPPRRFDSPQRIPLGNLPKDGNNDGHSDRSLLKKGDGKGGTENSDNLAERNSASPGGADGKKLFPSPSPVKDSATSRKDEAARHRSPPFVERVAESSSFGPPRRSDATPLGHSSPYEGSGARAESHGPPSPTSPSYNPRWSSRGRHQGHQHASLRGRIWGENAKLRKKLAEAAYERNCLIEGFRDCLFRYDVLHRTKEAKRAEKRLAFLNEIPSWVEWAKKVDTPIAELPCVDQKELEHENQLLKEFIMEASNYKKTLLQAFEDYYDSLPQNA